MSLTDDLTRLKDLDRATYVSYAAQVGAIRYEMADGLGKLNVDKCNHVTAKAILQHCPQEAIAARGWILEQSTSAIKPFAKIWKPGDAIWMLYIRCAESHVAALLACYIAALEA